MKLDTECCYLSPFSLDVCYDGHHPFDEEKDEDTDECRQTFKYIFLFFCRFSIWSWTIVGVIVLTGQCLKGVTLNLKPYWILSCYDRLHHVHVYVSDATNLVKLSVSMSMTEKTFYKVLFIMAKMRQKHFFIVVTFPKQIW